MRIDKIDALAPALFLGHLRAWVARPVRASLALVVT
jgi:hypothetical protein